MLGVLTQLWTARKFSHSQWCRMKIYSFSSSSLVCCRKLLLTHKTKIKTVVMKHTPHWTFAVTIEITAKIFSLKTKWDAKMAPSEIKGRKKGCDCYYCNCKVFGWRRGWQLWWGRKSFVSVFFCLKLKIIKTR